VRKHTENYQQKVKHLNSAVPWICWGCHAVRERICRYANTHMKTHSPLLGYLDNTHKKASASDVSLLANNYLKSLRETIVYDTDYTTCKQTVFVLLVSSC
jgi:hypothetical protein